MELQEGVLVPVQIVYQIPIAAILSDDVDGSCRETGKGLGCPLGLYGLPWERPYGQRARTH